MRGKSWITESFSLESEVGRSSGLLELVTEGGFYKGCQALGWSF